MFVIFRCSCLVGIALSVASGCSKGPSINTVPVTGKVTLDNQPLAGATVTFISAAPPGANAPPMPATGITGADGSYTLITMASGGQMADGVPPGNYKVTVTKQQAAPAQPNPMAGMNGLSDEERAKKVQSMSPDELSKMAGQAAQPGKGAGSDNSGIPMRYGKPDESGLTATVAASGAQTFDFPLTGQ